MVYQMFKRTTIKWFGGYDYYRINYMLFVLSIAWPLKREYFQHSWIKLKMLEIQQKMMLLMSVIVFFNMIFDAYLVWNKPEELNYSLSTSYFFAGSMYHFLTLVFNREELEASLGLLLNNFYLERIGNSGAELQILKSGEQQLKNLTNFFYFFTFLGLVTRIVCHLAPAEKTMLLPFPYSEKLATPFFEIMFFLQVFGLVHFLITLVASEMVVLGLLIAIIKHFEVLTLKITQIKNFYWGTDALAESKNSLSGKENLVIGNGNRVEVIKSRVLTGRSLKNSRWQKERIHASITDTIIHHQEILKVTNRVNGVLSSSFFLQIFGGGILLAILCVDLIWKSRTLSLKIIAQSVYAGGFFINIFILCFLGSKIETKSHQAASSLYEIPWQEMDPGNRRTLAFFLSGLWKHPMLKGAHLFPVNLKTYVNYLQLIYNSVGFMKNTVKIN